MPLSKLSQADQDYLLELDGNPFAGGEFVDTVDSSVPSDVSPGKPQGKSKKIDGHAYPIFLGDRSKTKELASAGSGSIWKVKPSVSSSTSVTDNFRPVVLYADSRIQQFDFVNKKELLTASASQKPLLFVGFHTGQLQQTKNFLERCDLSNGSGEIVAISDGSATFHDVSPKGDRVLASFASKEQRGFAKENLLGIFALDSLKSGSTLEPDVVFYPYYNPDKKAFERANEIKAAFWIDDSHILTKTEEDATLWDMTDCSAVSSIATAKSSETFAIEPSRKYFVLASGKRAAFYDSMSGDVLGVWNVPADERPTEKANVVDLASYLPVSCAFAPNGTKLAIGASKRVYTIDLVSGSTLNVLEIDEGLDANVVWANDDALIIRGVLYDVEKGLPLCWYVNFPMSPGEAINYFGRVWVVAKSGRKDLLFGTTLPHQKALDSLKELDTEKSFALRPGVGVAIKTELNGLLDEKKTTEYLEQRLLANGMKVDPNSSIVLKATCVDLKEKTEVAYGTGATIGLGLPVPGRMSTLGSIELEVFESSVEFLSGTKTIWRFARKTTGPDEIDYNPDKKVEESLRESNKPEIDFFKHAPIPRYVSTSGMGGRALMNAKLEPDGVK